MLALLAAAAIAAAPAKPLDVASAQLAIAPPAPPPLPLPDVSILQLGENGQRMTVPVQIDARGPWPFVIDTGAERTVVSRELAGVLGLSAGPTVNVIAMTGPVHVGSVVVPRLSVSRIAQDTIEAPALAAQDLGAAGMLGIDALQGHAVTIDFAHDRMTLRPARKRATAGAAPPPGEVVVTARSLFGQLIVTNAYWHGTRISVIVDTGSPVTVGNSALLAAITRKPKLIGPLEVLSATGRTLHTTAFAVDRIDVGGVGLRDMRVAFSDVPPFARFGLGATPALLLGMDALRLFRTVSIDFANREIRFALPPGVVDPNQSHDPFNVRG